MPTSRDTATDTTASVIGLFRQAASSAPRATEVGGGRPRTAVSPSTATAARCATPTPVTTASSASCSSASLTTPWSSTPTRRARCACSSAPASSRRCASARRPAESAPGRRQARPGRRDRAVKRHLLVTNDFPPKVGGIQNYLWELWSRLDPASFVVLTASSDAGAAAFDAAQAERGIHIERVPGRILFFPTPDALGRRPRRREGARRSTGAARPRPAARAARARTSTCPTASSCTAPRSPCPGRLPGSRAALARVLRGRRPGRLRRELPGRRGPARRARPRRHGWSRSRPASTSSSIVPLKAAERRAARARARAAGRRPAARQRQPARAA